MGLITLVLALGGCHAVMLNVDDVIVSPTKLAPKSSPQRTNLGPAAHLVAAPSAPRQSASGARVPIPTPAANSTIELRAYLERRLALLTVGRLAGVPIEFLRDGHVIGTAMTDTRGRATFTCTGGAATWRYSARAALPSGEFVSEGSVYVWPADHPAIVIDLDETLLQSRYVDMMLFINDPSPPLDHAHAVLHRLARDYGIIYISTRARLFRNMTQTWLREHKFPPGPIVHCDDFSAVFRQEDAKREMVRRLKQHINVVAGIGDKSFDEHAFRDNDILTIIIRPYYRPDRPETVVVSNWLRVPAALQRGGAPAQSTGTVAATSAAIVNR